MASIGEGGINEVHVNQINLFQALVVKDIKLGVVCSLIRELRFNGH